VKGGPRALTDRQKLFFLTDPLALSQLHFEVWTRPAAHPTWLAACLQACDGDRSAASDPTARSRPDTDEPPEADGTAPRPACA
ncbi:MAG TPA: hypothetical protein VLF19_08425, partial [Methylomirabilota bacterium]|nr:hypothetical protein [Methylomirabilota bacterium]